VYVRAVRLVLQEKGVGYELVPVDFARIARPVAGLQADEERMSAALPKAAICLSAWADLMADATWLAGPAISLADLHAAPICALFRRAPEGEDLLCTGTVSLSGGTG
jgi:glutathione S-transferase